MTDTTKRRHTVLGLLLMAFGFGVFGFVIVILARTDATVDWPVVALAALPLLPAVIGAWVLWPDQVGPILSDLIARWRKTP